MNVSELSKVEQVCFYYCRNDLSTLSKLLQSVSVKDRRVLLKTAKQLCETEQFAVTQQTFAQGECTPHEYCRTIFSLDKTGHSMLMFYRNLYNERLTRGLRKALLDQDLYRRFAINASTVKAVEPLSHQKHDIACHRYGDPIEYRTMKLVPENLHAVDCDSQQKFEVLSVGMDNISLLVKSKSNPWEGNSGYIKLRITLSEKLQLEANYQLVQCSEKSSIVRHLILRRVANNQRMEQAFFLACIKRFPLEKKQVQRCQRKWKVQNELMLHADSVIPVIVNCKNSDELTFVGVVDHPGNRKTLAFFGNDHSILFCKKTISRIINRHHPTKENYVIAVKSSPEHLIISDDLSASFKELVKLGLRKGNFLLFKVNVENVKAEQKYGLYQAYIGDELPADYAGDLKVVYLTALPIYEHKKHLFPALKPRALPADTVVENDLQRLPKLAPVDSDLRGETRYLWSTAVIVHHYVLLGKTFEMIDFSPSGLCLHSPPNSKPLAYQQAQYLSISIPMLQIYRVKYQVVTISQCGCRIHLKLSDRPKVMNEVQQQLATIISENNSIFNRRECEQLIQTRYRYFYLLAAQYLPHFTVRRELQSTTNDCKLTSYYRLRGVVDCNLPLIRRAGTGERFKLGDLTALDNLTKNKLWQQFNTGNYILCLSRYDNQAKPLSLSKKQEGGDGTSFCLLPEKPRKFGRLPDEFKKLLSNEYLQQASHQSKIPPQVTICHVSYLMKLFDRWIIRAANDEVFSESQGSSPEVSPLQKTQRVISDLTGTG